MTCPSKQTTLLMPTLFTTLSLEVLANHPPTQHVSLALPSPLTQNMKPREGCEVSRVSFIHILSTNTNNDEVTCPCPPTTPLSLEMRARGCVHPPPPLPLMFRCGRGCSHPPPSLCRVKTQDRRLLSPPPFKPLMFRCDARRRVFTTTPPLRRTARCRGSLTSPNMI